MHWTPRLGIPGESSPDSFRNDPQFQCTTLSVATCQWPGKRCWELEARVPDSPAHGLWPQKSGTGAWCQAPSRVRAARYELHVTLHREEG